MKISGNISKFLKKVDGDFNAGNYNFCKIQLYINGKIDKSLDSYSEGTPSEIVKNHLKYEDGILDSIKCMLFYEKNTKPDREHKYTSRKDDSTKQSPSADEPIQKAAHPFQIGSLGQAEFLGLIENKAHEIVNKIEHEKYVKKLEEENAEMREKCKKLETDLATKESELKTMTSTRNMLTGVSLVAKQMGIEKFGKRIDTVLNGFFPDDEPEQIPENATPADESGLSENEPEQIEKPKDVADLRRLLHRVIDNAIGKELKDIYRIIYAMQQDSRNTDLLLLFIKEELKAEIEI